MKRKIKYYPALLALKKPSFDISLELKSINDDLKKNETMIIMIFPR